MSDAKKVVSGIGGLRASLEAIGGCDCRTWDDLLKENKALLAEVERLQRERSEWCDQADRRLTDYMTQQRDLLAEVEALRARLTLTPEKIEAAIQARNDYIWRDGGIHAPTESGELRAALLAAGMTEEALQ